MDTNEVKQFTDVISDLRLSVDELGKTNKHIARAVARSLHPAFQSVNPDEVLAEVPVHLDWMTPNITGIAYIRKAINGVVQIDIRIVGEDASIVEHLIPRMPVESLQVSVMQP